MKLTVGPLPPAVYWRRRVVVLGGLLVAVLLLTSLCSTSSSGKAGQARTAGSRSSAGAEATATVLTPTTADPSEIPTSPPAPGPAGPPPPATTNAAPAPTGLCADADISVVAAPVATTVKLGSTLKIYLKVKNTSNRACGRDVGADAQELVIQQGKAKLWSSDDCDKLHGTDVKSFGPGIEVSFYVIWDGKGTSAGCDKKALPAPGTYQVTARLAAKFSDPVSLTIQQ
jgi:hypothetical protein